MVPGQFGSWHDEGTVPNVAASGRQSLLADKRTQAHNVNLVLLFGCSSGELLRVGLNC